MLKSTLIFALLLFTLNTVAQTILSNKISRLSGIHERIDFYDEDDNSIISLAPRFYRQREIKKWIKPIKVNKQTYFIKRNNRFGAQSVYINSGEHVANMESNGTKVHLVQDGSVYTLKPILRLANLNILECRNADGILISTISLNNDSRLVFENSNELSPNLLLLSLCAHQYQELLLGDKGKLSAFNSIQFITLNGM